MAYSNVAVCQPRDEESMIYALIVESVLKSPATFVSVNPKLTAQSITFLNPSSHESDQYYYYFLNQRTSGAPADSITKRLITEFQVIRQKGTIKKKKLPTKAIIFRNSEMKLIFKRGANAGWRSFYHRFPQSAGILQFSSIHYSHDRNYAILFYSFIRAETDGFGALAILTKTKVGWVIRQTVRIYDN